MKNILIKDGYVSYPDHWISLKNIDPAEATHCGVLSIRNGKKIGVPTFLFFLKNKTIDQISTDDEKLIYQSCIKHYPYFDSILKMQVKPKYDINNTIINLKEWNEAPTIGWFHVFDADEDYGPFNDALIYRTK